MESSNAAELRTQAPARRYRARPDELFRGRRLGDDLPAPSGLHRVAGREHRVSRARGRTRPLKLASGYVADHVSRRKPLVVFGYGIAAVVRSLVAIATAPWHVLAVRVTDRVGKGMRSAPRDVLIANSVAKEETGRAFGFHRAMDHAGAVVGPLVATALLVLGWPLRTVVWVALVPGVLSVLAVLTVREPKSSGPRRGRAIRLRRRSGCRAPCGPISPSWRCSRSATRQTHSCFSAHVTSASRWPRSRCSGRSSTSRSS